jgi:hypothetical protein
MWNMTWATDTMSAVHKHEHQVMMILVWPVTKTATFPTDGTECLLKLRQTNFTICMLLHLQ